MKFPRFLTTLILSAVPFAAQAQDHVTFQLDWLPGGSKAPVYVGIGEGYFAEVGIEVSIASGKGSNDALTKIAAGNSDIGFVDLTDLMKASAENTVPALAVFSYFSKGPHAIFTLESSGIESIADLAGKSVATSPFSSSNAFFPTVLEANGVAADSVKVTNADSGALGPLLATGKTDAVIGWVVNNSPFSAQAAATGQVTRVLPWSDAGVDLYGSSLVANETFLNESPDVAARFLAAFAKAVTFMKDNPEKAAADIKAIVPEVDVTIATNEILDSLPLIFNEISERDGLGNFEPGRVAQTWSLLTDATGTEESALEPQAMIYHLPAQN